MTSKPILPSEKKITLKCRSFQGELFKSEISLFLSENALFKSKTSEISLLSNEIVFTPRESKLSLFYIKRVHGFFSIKLLGSAMLLQLLTWLHVSDYHSLGTLKIGGIF